MSSNPGEEAVRAFIDAFNKQDMEARADAFNFPHIRLANKQFIHFDTRSDYLQSRKKLKDILETEGWDHSVIESMKTIHVGSDKIHIDLEYTRRHADDSVYTRFNSLWIATHLDNHWGIQFRSSYLIGDLPR